MNKPLNPTELYDLAVKAVLEVDKINKLWLFTELAGIIIEQTLLELRKDELEK